jgi:hypothetical protein
MTEIKIDTESLYQDRAQLINELENINSEIGAASEKSKHGSFPIELLNKKQELQLRLSDIEKKLVAFIEADIAVGKVESSAVNVIGDLRSIQEEPDSKHIENIEKQIRELAETTSRTIQQLKTASLASGIEPRLSVVQPNVRLVDANLAYKYADIQSDINIVVGFTTLFLGTAIASCISLLLAIIAISPDRTTISVHATVTIMSFIVSAIFGYLWFQVRRKSEIAKKLLEDSSGEREVNLRLSSLTTTEDKGSDPDKK